MQVCGGSQSFNAVNQMRILGRWMRMITIPNQSSVAKAWQEFDEDGRMKPSPYYDRIVDVMEELMKFTLLTRGMQRISSIATVNVKSRRSTFPAGESEQNLRAGMSDVTAFNNCMSVFWQQHEAELSRFLASGQAIGSRQPICFRKSSCAPGLCRPLL